MLNLKRTHCEFQGGTLQPLVGSAVYREVPKQPVKIIKLIEEDDDDDWYQVQALDGNRYRVGAADLHPHPTAPLTNTEFLTQLMEFGGERSGALIQPFVLEAIRIYAEQVRAGPASHFGNALISGEAWKRAAEDALAALEERKNEGR